MNGNERLLKLADFLEHVPDEHFSLEDYSNSPAMKRVTSRLRTLTAVQRRAPLAGVLSAFLVSGRGVTTRLSPWTTKARVNLSGSSYGTDTTETSDC